MKTKLISKICLFLSLLIPLFLSSCSSQNTYYNLESNDSFLTFGEQEVTISVMANTENPVTFKSTITTSDIRFSLLLEGRTAKIVTYVTETSIKVTLDGEAKMTGSESYGRFDILPSGITSGDTCFGTTNVPSKPGFYTINGGSYLASESGIVKAENTFTPNYGKFLGENITSKYVTFAGKTGELAISYSKTDNSVKITITNWTFEGDLVNPVVHFDAKTWDYGYSVDVKVGLLIPTTFPANK